MTTFGKITGKIVLAGAGDRGAHKNVRDNMRQRFRDAFGDK
jgi:hypothetical protein